MQTLSPEPKIQNLNPTNIPHSPSPASRTHTGNTPSTNPSSAYKLTHMNGCNTVNGPTTATDFNANGGEFDCAKFTDGTRRPACYINKNNAAQQFGY